MSLTDRTKPGETFNSPSKLSDRELLNVPLRILSRGISITTSLSTTAKVYLRWIEAHRVANSKFTEHWDNTILHWAQSLRARGFKSQGIINEILIWKKEVGPLPLVDGRRPLESSDIENAYNDPSECSKSTKTKDETSWKREIQRDDLAVSYHDEPERSYHTQVQSSYEKYRSLPKKKLYDNFQEAPPPSYICNRCGKKGVFLPASIIYLKIVCCNTFLKPLHISTMKREIFDKRLHRKIANTCRSPPSSLSNQYGSSF
jgi:hypothetical protein